LLTPLLIFPQIPRVHFELQLGFHPLYFRVGAINERSDVADDKGPRPRW
jgi:hypothetical protein